MYFKNCFMLLSFYNISRSILQGFKRITNGSSSNHLKTLFKARLRFSLSLKGDGRGEGFYYPARPILIYKGYSATTKTKHQNQTPKPTATPASPLVPFIICL